MKEEGEVKISDYLKEDRIVLNLQALKKEDVIKELARLLQEAEEVTDFDLFLKDIFERETLNTTGIGNHLAIPHARTDAVKEFVLVFGRVPQGLDFNSLDGKPAKFFFLLGTPKKKGLNTYINTLAHLTRLMNKAAFQEALLKAPGPKEIIEEFRKIEP